MFEKVKYYYDNGNWDIVRVRNVVRKVITEEEFFEITGFIYPSVD